MLARARIRHETVCELVLAEAVVIRADTGEADQGQDEGQQGKGAESLWKEERNQYRLGGMNRNLGHSLVILEALSR